ncbi:MAG: prepilin-type N-terminal cleavage/methylation domain-containing protein [Bacteroidota bacterium]
MWNKWKAFTLLEMLLAATITAILISLSMWGYELFQKQYLFFEKTQDQIWETQQLINQLHYQSLDCSLMRKESNLLRLEWDSLSRQYAFEPDRVLMTTYLPNRAIQDTFLVSVLISEASFQEQAVDNGPIDRLTFEISAFEQPYLMVLEKRYSAIEQMKMEQQ